MIAFLAFAWLVLAIPSSLLIGGSVRIADRRELLISPAGPSGEESRPRRGLPAHLPPRAGAGTRRFLRRVRPYGWLVGLLLAGVLCVALSALQGLTPATAIR